MKTITISAVVALISGFSAISAADDSTPKLHPIEAVCIEYDMSGQMQQGKSRQCHRDYAYEQFIIQESKVSFGGFSQAQNTHNIVIGDTIYAIDLSTNTGTKMVNPMYDGIVNAMQDSNAEDMAEVFITAMGFVATGSSKTIAGAQCQIYSSDTIGTMCITDDGLMLEQSVMGNTQIATNVTIGDSGDDADYLLYQSVPITDAPAMPDMPSFENLQDLQELLKQGQQQ